MTDDDRDKAEKCDGAAETDSWRWECRVAALAADGVREGWGVIERSREIEGCK